MNSRQRKKYLRKHGLYIDESEVWNLNATITDFILPRLKKFKKITKSYPGREGMETFEMWNEALDKMIRSFELLQEDPLDMYYEYLKTDYEKYKELTQEYYKEVKEGLHLFAEWFQDLWI